MPTFDLINYRLEAEWLLTWYPLVRTADLKEVRIRGGTASHSTAEFGPGVLGGGTSTTYIIGQGAAGDGEPLAADNLVRAFVKVGTTDDQLFEIEADVNLGQAHRTKRVVLPPDTRIPVMINVHASDESSVIKGTAAVLQCVFTAGHRATLAEFITRGIGIRGG